MTQRRSHHRTPLERYGNNDWRASGEIQQHLLEDTSDGSPSCHIFVSKRKGFGTTGNKQSNPTSIHGIELLKKSFPPDNFHRYVGNVYLKSTGAAAARRTTRGW